MKRISSLILLLTLVTSLFAQDVTYSEAQQLARDNYPLVKRYDLISRTEQLTLSNVSKQWLPQVQIDAQATWQNRVTEWADGMKGMMEQYGISMKGLKKDQYNVGFSVNQMVYDGGSTSAQRTVAKAQAKVDEAQNTTELYALRERIDEIFFSILLTDGRLLLNEEMQKTLKSNEEKLRKMLGQGTTTQSDVNAMTAELLTTQQQHTELETTRDALLSVLSVFLGKEVHGVIKPSPADVTMGDAANRPELEQYRLQTELVNAQKKTLDSGLMPKVGVFANGYYGYPGYNMFNDMMKHDWSFNVMLGAKVTWDIGSLYTRKNDLAKLQNQRDEIATAQETFLFNNKLQQSQESTTIIGYKRLIQQDDEIVQLRQRVRKAAEAKLDYGIVDVNDLVQEISKENQASINKTLHEVELLKHQYSLATIKGE